MAVILIFMSRWELTYVTRQRLVYQVSEVATAEFAVNTKTPPFPRFPRLPVPEMRTLDRRSQLACSVNIRASRVCSTFQVIRRTLVWKLSGV